MGAPGPRILVVDDDRDIQETLVELLEEEGYAVRGASDGLEALELLRMAKQTGGEPLPDLILLDLMMPRMDGARFREEQLQDPALAPIPTLVLSADSRLDEQCDALGIGAWLHKPVDLDELLDAVAQALGR